MISGRMLTMFWKKTLICALCLILAVLTLSAPAETVVEDELAEDLAIEPLPIDFSAGPVPLEDNYTIQEDGVSVYEDASISVRMERVEYNNDVYNVARVKIADASQLRTALSSSYKLGQKSMRIDRISTMAKNSNAIVAIGGDYFYNESRGIVVRQGETLRKTFKNKNFKTDLLVIDGNGDFHIIRNQDAEELKKWTQSEAGAPNVFDFGPALIIDGLMQEMPKTYSYDIRGREPRCGIGQIGPLEYLLVVVDGRRANSDGTTCAVLAQFMLEQGCIQAYNLDGGNSALMVFHNENYSNKTVKAERSVSDIIYFATAIRTE